MQVKLLRALQDGEIDPVGARRPVRVDFRLISATNRSLIDLVKAGRFREDLYYRLNVFPIRVPPLARAPRGHPRAGPPLRRALRRRGGQGVHPRRHAPRRSTLLTRYDWPGNVRQLENAVFRAVVLADGPMLTPDEFPQIAAQVDGAPPPPAEAPLRRPSRSRSPSPMRSSTPRRRASPRFDENGDVRPLAEVEAAMIRLALERYAGRMTLVARKLGIGRSTLYRKLKDLGISDTVAGIAAE